MLIKLIFKRKNYSLKLDLRYSFHNLIWFHSGEYTNNAKVMTVFTHPEVANYFKINNLKIR